MTMSYVEKHIHMHECEKLFRVIEIKKYIWHLYSSDIQKLILFLIMHSDFGL